MPAPSLPQILARLERAYPDARCALDHQDPFQLVVATILSAQCTDARVNITTPALFRRYPDAASLAQADPGELEGLIRSTGFYRNKARNLLAMARLLVDRHGGQVPRERESLAALPGVGPKTANVVLANAFQVPALAVDTHIFRVARRLGLSQGNNPDKVEADLRGHFPQETWIALHHQLIWHGRQVCDARKPSCSRCVLLDLCPTGQGRIPDPHSGVRFPQPGGKAQALPDPSPATGEGPRRIVSLVPSVTELLAQWGLGTRLVGRTAYCVEPPWIRTSVPPMGGNKNPDIPRILSLKPDLVILERDENTLEAAQSLASHGLELLVLEIRSLKDCLRAFRILGKALGVPQAGEERAAGLKSLLKPRPPRGRSVLTLIWKDPWMSAGPGTYVGDLVRQTGNTPLGPDRYPVLSGADLRALDPDLILLPSEPYRFTRRDEAELAKSHPRSRVIRLDGRALTWYLSRSEAALEHLRSRLTLAP